MMVEIFTLSFDDQTGGFDAGPVNRFLLNRKLLEMKESFFIREGHPFWSVLVKYEEIMVPDKSSENKKTLNQWQQMLFERLKEWRKKRAGEEGIPTYLVATNRELLEIIETKAQSIEELKSIRGFGSKKMKKYGKELAGLLQAFFKRK